MAEEFNIGGKKAYYKVSQASLIWAKNKSIKKPDGECTFKSGSTLTADGASVTFGPDSKGQMITAKCGSAEQAQKIVDTFQSFTEGEVEEDADILKQGWLSRDKKRYFFTVSEGYLSWYHKEPSPSIPHNKNFVKELALSNCEIKANGNSIDLGKTTEVKGKKETKVYKLTAEGDIDGWMDALTKAAAIADEEGIGMAAGKKAGLGARMKKGMAQSIATSKGGKKMAKKALPDEVTGLLVALKQTFEAYAGKARAEEVESNMVRIITKLFFAVNNKQVDVKALLPADKHLRDALKWLSLVWGQRFRSILIKKQPPKEKEALNKVSEDMKQVEKVLIKGLEGVVQPKSIALIKSTLKFLVDHKYLTFVVEADNLEEARSDLEMAMDAYCAIELDPSAFD